MNQITMLLFDCDGVLTDGRIVLGNAGQELKFFSTKDGMGLSIWRRAGFTCGCITGRASEALERRARELSFDELHQGIKNKREVLYEIMNRRHLTKEQIAFVGDDFNDLVLLNHVGTFFATADAHPEVRKHAHVTLPENGGAGAVRAAVDLLLTHKGLLQNIISSYIEEGA
jgi:3-deoxy-D-manno-octulosonate 8-phosphate phosphatase (KDO 8-P phosphatase)